MQLKALLFDLDGTLIDTAPDMVGSLNRILLQHGYPAADTEAASLLVSNGAKALIEFGFSGHVNSIQFPELVQEFLADYAEHVSRQSLPYEGILQILELCEKNSVRWGVVTNKPLALARSLLDDLDLLERCSILLGGDSLPVKKPDPAPLLHCTLKLGLAASECLYVGDHERDIVAGNRAGMDTAAALWGYLQEHDSPQDWNANYLIQSPRGLHTLITERITPVTPDQ